MKKFKKLIPALCLLLLSAVLLGGTTFAWFSMNNKVTANNMEVTAKSNTQFLVISASNTLGTSIETTVATPTGGIEGKVYPCAKATADKLPTATGIAVGDWYTANSKVLDDAGAVGTTNFANAKKIETSELGNYHLTYTFYIGLADGSEEYNGDVTFKATTFSGTANGVTAMITYGDDTTELGQITAQDGTVTKTGATLKENTAVKITVILYIDGNNANVKSSNLSAITGNLSLQVSIA